MISNPNFILYACIAKGTTILAQHRYNEPKIEELASKCLEQVPLHHSMFSHTVKKRTYAFLIDQAFVYFAIFDEQLVRSEALWFLDRIKCALDEILKGGSIKDSDDLSPLCFQAQFDPIFGESTTSPSQSEKPLLGENKHDQNPSVGSMKRKKSVMVPLFEQASESLEKGKRVSTESNGIDGKDATGENKLEVGGGTNGYARDFALPTTPKGGANDRQRAKQIWKRHVWVVLLLDMFVCAMLFVFWLWVCRGFKCMQS